MEASQAVLVQVSGETYRATTFHRVESFRAGDASLEANSRPEAYVNLGRIGQRICTKSLEIPRDQNLAFIADPAILDRRLHCIGAPKLSRPSTSSDSSSYNTLDVFSRSIVSMSITQVCQVMEKHVLTSSQGSERRHEKRLRSLREGCKQPFGSCMSVKTWVKGGVKTLIGRRACTAS